MEHEFGRDLGSLEQVFAFFESFVQANGLSLAQSFPLRVAIEEVFVNMIEHNPSGEGLLGLTLRAEGTTAIALLRDPDGEPYDITQHQARSTTAPLQERRPGGLGIHLVNQLMDEVSFSYSRRETLIRLVKHRPANVED